MNNKAFTLVELLAVIVILAIILAVAIPRISNIIESAEKSSFVSSTKLLIRAVQTKLLEDNNFDITTINKSNMKTLLNIPDDNYESISIKYDSNGKIYINLKGADKWSDLTTIGNYENITFIDNIVTDGLVMHLDAGNSNSYPGSGTKWYDLSGNGYYATLNNGVSYDENNGGSLVFDGINDYAIGASTLNINNNVTLEAFIYPTSYPVDGGFIISNLGYYLELYKSGVIRSYYYGLSTEGYHYGTSTIPLNTWTHVAVVRDQSNNTIKHYVNGNIDNTITPITGDIRNGIMTFQIGKYANGGYIFIGNISIVKIYNKALTASEIDQNYSATKQRYGL